MNRAVARLAPNPTELAACLRTRAVTCAGPDRACARLRALGRAPDWLLRLLEDLDDRLNVLVITLPGSDRLE